MAVTAPVLYSLNYGVKIKNLFSEKSDVDILLFYLVPLSCCAFEMFSGCLVSTPNSTGGKRRMFFPPLEVHR